MLTGALSLLRGRHRLAHRLALRLHHLRPAALLRRVDRLRRLVAIQHAAGVSDHLGLRIHDLCVDQLRLQPKLAVEVALDGGLGHLDGSLLVLRALRTLLDLEPVGAAPQG